MGHEGIVYELRVGLGDCLNKKQMEAIAGLYSDKLYFETSGGPREISEIKSKKGQWKVFYQKNALVDKFCAVYMQGEKGKEIPRTLVKGDLFDESTLEQTINAITPKILEESKLSLEHWDSRRASNFLGTAGMVVGPMVVFPLFFLGRVLHAGIFGSIIAMAGASIAGRHFGAKYGDVIEQRIEEGLPEGSKLYSYGINALAELEVEGKMGHTESDSAKRYKALLEAGVDIAKNQFPHLDIAMKKVSSQIAWLSKNAGETDAKKILEAYGGVK